MRIRLRPMPARQRRSSTSRTSSREAYVSSTFRTRKIAQTTCETSNTPRARAALPAKYVCVYRVAMMPKTTARMLPTKT